MQKRTAVGFLVNKIPAYKNTKTKNERTQKKKSEKKRIQKENRKNQKT